MNDLIVKTTEFPADFLDFAVSSDKVIEEFWVEDEELQGLYTAFQELQDEKHGGRCYESLVDDDDLMVMLGYEPAERGNTGNWGTSSKLDQDICYTIWVMVDDLSKHDFLHPEDWHDETFEPDLETVHPQLRHLVPKELPKFVFSIRQNIGDDIRDEYSEYLFGRWQVDDYIMPMDLTIRWAAIPVDKYTPERYREDVYYESDCEVEEELQQFYDPYTGMVKTASEWEEHNEQFESEHDDGYMYKEALEELKWIEDKNGFMCCINDKFYTLHPGSYLN
jgi:hypothetical protein